MRHSSHHSSVLLLLKGMKSQDRGANNLNLQEIWLQLTRPFSSIRGYCIFPPMGRDEQGALMGRQRQNGET